MVKETRLYRKLEAVAALDPEGALVHLVRDPRSVVTSTMLGRGRRHAERYPSADDFFEARTKRKLWSSRALSEGIIGASGSGVAKWRRPPDFVRVLAVSRGDDGRTFRVPTCIGAARAAALEHLHPRSPPGSPDA